jgi:hypothetical protein
MKQFYGTMAGLCFGLSIGIAFAWAVTIQHDREEAALISELNAARVMAEWDRFEEGRK